MTVTRKNFTEHPRPLGRRNMVHSYLVGNGVIGAEKAESIVKLWLPFDQSSSWCAVVMGRTEGPNGFRPEHVLSSVESENVHPMIIRATEREIDRIHVTVRLADMLPYLVALSEGRI